MLVVGCLLFPVLAKIVSFQFWPNVLSALTRCSFSFLPNVFFFSFDQMFFQLAATRWASDRHPCQCTMTMITMKTMLMITLMITSMVRRIMMMSRRSIIDNIGKKNSKDKIDYWDNDDHGGHDHDQGHDDNGDLDIRAAKTALTIGSLASRYSNPPRCQTKILEVNIGMSNLDLFRQLGLRLAGIFVKVWSLIIWLRLMHWCISHNSTWMSPKQLSSLETACNCVITIFLLS